MVQRAMQVQLPVSPQAAVAGALKLPNCSPQGVGKRDLGIEYGLHKLLPVVSAAKGVKRACVTAGNGREILARTACSHLLLDRLAILWAQLQHIHATTNSPPCDHPGYTSMLAGRKRAHS